MQRTLFRTPLLKPALGVFARLLLRLLRWRLVGAAPAAPRYVLIAAPHTSNWDFPLMLLVVLRLGLDLHWLGKDSLFAWPFGGLMRWLGGIAIDRSKANDRVAQLAALYGRREALVLLIPPEGTRARVERWKSGFYHIARGAEVPIQLGFIDAGRRELGFGPLFHPTGDFAADVAVIQAFYTDKRGLRR